MVLVEGCLRICMHEREREIIHMFYPNDKDGRLSSVASDVEVLNAPNIPMFRNFDDSFSFHLGQLTNHFHKH